ncbi:MAG: hypothetical protein ABIT71_07345 [Vicinamibacteraceae bacterium]
MTAIPKAVRALVTLAVLATLTPGCSSRHPNAPTPTANADVSGTWFPVGNSGPGLRLVQRGTAVDGTGIAPATDIYPATMTVIGSVAGAEFQFAATAVSSQPDGEHRTLLNGTLTVSGGTMTGMISSVPQPPFALRPALTQVTFARTVAGP